MICFAFPEQAVLAASLGWPVGQWEWRHFPDGESYVRVHSAVQGQQVGILCSLNQPDAKLLPLVFLASALRQQGAARITLVAPYLAYMRQDIAFHTGEAVTSEIFAPLLSRYVDALVTIDPHLHRHASLEAIYSCQCTVLSAAPLMAAWIKEHLPKPLLIGPDAESEQWVAQVAKGADAPHVVLSKQRHGDHEVEITLPSLAAWAGRTPVLVDDIISTGGTMAKACGLLRAQGFTGLHCLATHALFAEGALEKLHAAGIEKIVTTNTIAHASNGMDVAGMVGRI